jgi:hypothetical protein
MQALIGESVGGNESATSIRVGTPATNGQDM